MSRLRNETIWGGVRNRIRRRRIVSSQPGDGLADDLEVALNGLAEYAITFVFGERSMARRFKDEARAVADDLQVSGGLIVHTTPSESGRVREGTADSAAHRP